MTIGRVTSALRRPATKRRQPITVWTPVNSFGRNRCTASRITASRQLLQAHLLQAASLGDCLTARYTSIMVPSTSAMPKQAM